MYFLATSTDQLVLLLFIIIFFSVLKKTISGVQAIHILSTGIFAWVIGYFIKGFFYLPRPFIAAHTQPLVNYLMDGSFPSNHTTLSFALSFSMYFWNKKIGLVMLFISTLVGLGRIFALVHSPLDVSGGIILAFVISWATKRYLVGKLRD